MRPYTQIQLCLKKRLAPVEKAAGTGGKGGWRRVLLA
jgi:hypothetical protein